ncbi:MAG: restriction endonuclease [Patescibacteria group bacterium]
MQNQLPKFYETFIPILQVLSDGKTITMGELRERVHSEFFSDLEPALLELTTKNGQMLLLNRIGWGKAYLKQGKYIDSPSRGLVKITDKGSQALKKGILTLEELEKDTDYLSYHKTARNGDVPVITESNSSPQDLIESGIKSIEQQLKAELLERLRSTDPYYFQKVILLLLQKMGYGDFIETPKSGDGGIDGIINEDKLGLDKIYIQAKRYADGNKVRELEVRNFIGAMSRDTHKGIFVTTSDFDEKAVQKARDAQQKIILINAELIVELMIRYDVGVQVKSHYEVKELDEDFFEE